LLRQLRRSGSPNESTQASSWCAQFTIEDRAFTIGVSIGVAICPDHGTDGNTLLRRADMSMYSAKRSHAGHAVYSRSLDYNSPDRMDLLGELRTSIEQDQLVHHYQPLMDFRTHEIVRAEALVRWQHPRHGLVLPANFIPIAEQIGLIKPLSNWVLSAALYQARTWWDDGYQTSVGVNLSAQTLHNPDLVRTVMRLLDHWRMPTSSLKLEITENSLLVEPTRALDVLHNLRRLGTRVGIADFGTGFSPLAYLKRRPIDEMKIDKGFVLQTAKGETDSAIVRSTIRVAHELGLSVVAEGVETLTTWNLLAELGCDTAQGFFLSPPIAANGFTRWLDHVIDNRAGEMQPNTPSGLWRPALPPGENVTRGRQS
jgi:EAL domain-containing protein (putative c-di-GMP-specific phosphodiesterase class I)